MLGDDNDDGYSRDGPLLLLLVPPGQCGNSYPPAIAIAILAVPVVPAVVDPERESLVISIGDDNQ